MLLKGTNAFGELSDLVSSVTESVPIPFPECFAEALKLSM